MFAAEETSDLTRYLATTTTIRPTALLLRQIVAMATHLLIRQELFYVQAIFVLQQPAT